MRTALYVFGTSLALYAPLQSVAAAPVFSSLLSNVMPHSRAARHLDAHNHAHEARGLISSLTDDTVLESLRILPDDDDDGLLDLEGRLKVLKDGELLDLEGIVSVGNVLDACVEVNIGGKLTKRCHDHNSNKKHYRDTWTKEEHRRCSKHFKEWHHKHGHGGSCGDKLEAAQRRIAELERQLRDCKGESTAPRRPKNVLAVRPRPAKNSWSDDNDGRSWHDKVMAVRPSRDNDNDNGRDNTDREEQHRPSPTPSPTHRGPKHDDNGKGCDGILKEHVDENGIHAQVCVSAGVSIAGVQATASASATVDVDLARGQASAEATATVGANVGSLVSAGVKASATASVDLKKGEAEVKVNTDETLKLGNKKVLDTGIDAQIAVNKKCGKGEVLDLAGLCVALKTDDKKSGSSDSGSPASSILNNVLGGVRVL